MLKFLKIKTKKRAVILSVVFLIFAGAIFLHANHADAFLVQYYFGKWVLGKIADTVISYVLGGIYYLATLLMVVAGVILGWALDPAHVSGDAGLYNKDAIVGGWKIIRDFLNLAFIFVLLMSAFSTIFQYQKYHLKNIIWTLILMALLVNFSFPITRFLIDVSNVTLYFFLESFFREDIYNVSGNGSSIFVKILKESRFDDLMLPEDFDDYPITTIIAMIIFTFLLAFTLLTIALLMLVRMFGFAILIITSPIAFVFQILPAGQSVAKSWWEKLFKLMILGPGLMFVAFLSIKIMQQIGADQAADVLDQATKNSTEHASSLIATMAYLILPIAILWLGILEVIKMGALAGGSLATATMRAPGQLAGWTSKTAWRKSGIPGGIKAGYQEARKSGRLFGSSRLGSLIKDRQPGRESIIAGTVTGGARGGAAAARARATEERKEGAKHYKPFAASDREKMLDETTDEGKDLNDTERAKVAQSMVDDKIVNAGNLDKILAAAKKDQEMMREVMSTFMSSKSVTNASEYQSAMNSINTNFGSDPAMQAKLQNDLRSSVDMGQIVATANETQVSNILRMAAPDQQKAIKKEIVNSGRVDLTFSHDRAAGESADNIVRSTFSNAKNGAGQKNALRNIGDGSELSMSLENYLMDLKTSPDANDQKHLRNLWKEMDHDVRQAIITHNPGLAP